MALTELVSRSIFSPSCSPFNDYVTPNLRPLPLHSDEWSIFHFDFFFSVKQWNQHSTNEKKKKRRQQKQEMYSSVGV